MISDSTVSILPWYQIAEPFLVAIVDYVVLPLFLGWIGYLLNRFLGIKITDSANARFQTEAENAAGMIFANLEPSMANMRIDVHSPMIAAEVPKVEAKVAESIATLGIKPEDVAQHVADAVTGKLGQLQAQAAAVNSVPPAGMPVAMLGGH